MVAREGLKLPTRSTDSCKLLSCRIKHRLPSASRRRYKLRGVSTEASRTLRQVFAGGAHMWTLGFIWDTVVQVGFGGALIAYRR